MLFMTKVSFIKYTQTNLKAGVIGSLGSHSGLSLGGNLGEKDSLNRLNSPCFELREKFKFIEHVRNSKIMAKTSP